MDLSGWNHVSDADFSANLTFNDANNTWYTSWTSIDSHNIYINSRSFKRPVFGESAIAGELKTYEPNIFGCFKESWLGKTWVGEFAYNFVDDTAIALQSILCATYPTHLDGVYVNTIEKLNAGVNALLNIPIQGVGNVKKVVSASKFNSLYKGSGINAATAGGVFIRQYNHVIRNKTMSRKWYYRYSNGLSIIDYMNNKYND